MESYMGSSEKWASAETQLQNIVSEKVGNNYIKGVGEAAFYGPKLDFMAKDAIGREHQVATIQLDFNMPEGFNLFCTNEDGEQERIVMVHCAIAGSLERCLSVLIEHYAGKFPVWLAPEQVRIITVNQEENTTSFADAIYKKARSLGLRVCIDNDNESVGKK